jgi:hypothetical protein
MTTDVERIVELHLLNWGDTAHEQLAEYLLTSVIPRRILEVNVDHARALATLEDRSSTSLIRLAAALHLERNPDDFASQDVLEIGSGNHVYEGVVSMCNSYTSVDPLYLEFDSRGSADERAKLVELLRRVNGCPEDPISHSGPDAEESFTGLDEFGFDGCKWFMAAGVYQNITRGAFGVVIDGGVKMTTPADVEAVKKVMQPDAVFVCPNSPLGLLADQVGEKLEDHFSDTKETWVLLKHPTIRDRGLYVVREYRQDQ